MFAGQATLRTNRVVINLDNALFSSDLWEAALEKYAGAAHLTVKLFDADQRAVFGPVHATPLFRLFDESGYDPGLFAECARRCIAQTDKRPSVLVSQFHGLAVVGTSLMLEGKIVGAAVGGYAFADFSQVSEIQRLALQSGIAFERLWEIARKQPPVPQGRLTLHGELLQVLGDALLRENYRARQYEQAAAIINSSEDAIISIDLDGVITSWNKGAERLFGYTVPEAVDRLITILIPPDRLQKEPGILERIRRGESIEHYETVRRRKDGALLDISLTVSPITDARGRIVGASKIARDITERKRMEDSLRRKTVEAQEASRLKSQFVSNVSHELRTPLNAIIGYSTLLLEEAYGALDEKQKDPLSGIHRNADDLRHLVTDILDLSRMEAGKLTIHLEPLKVDALFKEVVAGMKSLLEKKALAVQWAIQEGLPLIESDAGKIRQIFTNLLSNAIKFTPKGEITIAAKDRPEKKEIEVEIRDTGIGIKPEELAKIFDAFHQADADLTREFGGVGLGLAIVKELVQLLKGGIAVESEYGRGSAFTLFLPYRLGGG